MTLVNQTHNTDRHLPAVSNLNAMCGDRLWAFERVVGAFLDGFDDREEHNVQTKTECEKLCLFETAFTCRCVVMASPFFPNVFCLFVFRPGSHDVSASADPPSSTRGRTSAG